ncbi:MAG: transposase [Clostridia bacterium]|nr:transposase [Clostridia bacterium]
MSLKHDIRVPLPEDKIYRRKQDSNVYIYYYKKYYRNDDGNPRNDAVNIGKLDEGRNMLIPNERYYEIFDHSKDIDVTPPVSTQNIQFGCSLGYSLVMEKAAKDLGLLKYLDKRFGAMAPRILTLATYMLLKGPEAYCVDDYMDSHYNIFTSVPLTSQRASEVFDSIDDSGMEDFFTEWISKCKENECIVYDVTSVSTYSDNIIEAEYGYNRDHESLKQLNMGLFSGTKSRLPVYYEVYNGSITDKVNMTAVLRRARRVGIDTADFVMDGGFWDVAKLKELYDDGVTFTVGIPSYLDIAKDAFKDHGAKVDSFANSTSYESTYAAMYDKEIGGMKGRILVGLNTATRDRMRNDLKKDIKIRSKELDDKQVKKYSTVTKRPRYTDLFDIYPDDDEKGYTYAVKSGHLDELSSMYGYFFMFTTNMTATADDILFYYRSKDVDEKTFCELKDEIGFDRPRTHNSSTTSGKVFTLFISIILRRYLDAKLDAQMRKDRLSLKKCLLKLENIYAIKSAGQKAVLVKALTRQQREMLETLGIDINTELERL